MHGTYMGERGTDAEYKRMYGHQQATHTRCSAVLTMLFSKEVVAHLQKFLASYPDVKLVLSSSWRLDSWGPKELQEVFGRYPFLASRLTECTPDGNKYTCIRKWLTNNPNCTHYAILDDVSLGDKNQVLVSSQHLLQSADLDQVAKILELQ